MEMQVRALRVDLTWEGKICGWCKNGLQVGEYLALCATCEKPHCGRCWEDKAGCSTVRCPNAPLLQRHVALSARTPAPGAISSLVYGILGWFVFWVLPIVLFLPMPLLFGVLAIAKARSASTAMASNPMLRGKVWATAGFVVGVLDLLWWVFILVVLVTVWTK